MTALTMVPSETEGKFEHASQSLAVQVAELTIDSQASYATAADVLKLIDDLIDEVSRTFDPVVAAAHKAHKAATTARATHLDPLAAAKKATRAKMGEYVSLQERVARQHQIEAEADARKAQEEARLAEAAALEAMGETAAAEAVLVEAIEAPPAPPPVAAPAVEKVAGISSRETWHAEVTDLRAIARAVADGSAPLTLIAEGDTGAWARATKGSVVIPGLRVYPRTEVVNRRVK